MSQGQAVAGHPCYECVPSVSLSDPEGVEGI